MPRAKSNARKTTIGIPADIDGWLEYAGRGVEGGMTGYLADLVRRDRDRFMAAPDDDGLAERYRAFLLATGRDAELAEAASPYLAGGDAYAERVAELAEALTL